MEKFSFLPSMSFNWYPGVENSLALCEQPSAPRTEIAFLASSSNFKEVNKRIEDHFSKILSSKIAKNDDVQRVNFNQFAKDVEIPSLSNEEQIEMENDLTMEEIKRVIKLFSRNKTPGDDGFSVEFYEAFLDLLGGNLLDCYNVAFHENQLSISQRRGIISLIPKKRKLE